jgi:hypothetical protein
MSETSIKDFLAKISSGVKDTVDVTLQSSGKTIKCNILSLKQQKDIISCIADGLVGIVSFTRIINNIIEEVSSCNDILITDKPYVIIPLRFNALGTSYKNEDGTSLDISPILETLKTKKLLAKTSDSITFNNITVNVRVPTIKEESDITKKLEDEIKRNGEKNNTKNLGSIYIYEILKYIKSLEFDDSVLNFEKLPIKDKLEVIESLPLAHNKLIIQFIEAIRAEERDLLTVNDTVIEINPGFFNTD